MNTHTERHLQIVQYQYVYTFTISYLGGSGFAREIPLTQLRGALFLIEEIHWFSLNMNVNA